MNVLSRARRLRIGIRRSCRHLRPAGPRQIAVGFDLNQEPKADAVGTQAAIFTAFQL